MEALGPADIFDIGAFDVLASRDFVKSKLTCRRIVPLVLLLGRRRSCYSKYNFLVICAIKMFTCSFFLNPE